jgi:single-strand DNA-binding protein
MPNLNRVQIIGRLGKDPEEKTIPSGRTLVVFPVAVDRLWKSRNGESRKETDWFNVEAWGKLGEICQKYLGKGRLVYIEGRLRTSRYEHEGETRYATKVVAERMQMLERHEKETGEPVEADIENEIPEEEE